MILNTVKLRKRIAYELVLDSGNVLEGGLFVTWSQWHGMTELRGLGGVLIVDFPSDMAAKVADLMNFDNSPVEASVIKASPYLIEAIAKANGAAHRAADPAEANEAKLS